MARHGISTQKSPESPDDVTRAPGVSHTGARHVDATEPSDPSKFSKLDEMPMHTRLVAAARTDRARRWFYILWSVVAIGVIGYSLGFVLGVLSTAVGILVWTLIIVFVLQGLVEWIAARGVSRGLSVVLAYIVMFVVVAALGWLLFSPMAGFARAAAGLLTTLAETVRDATDISSWLPDRYQWVVGNAQVQQWMDSVSAQAGMAVQQIAGQSATGIVSITSAIAGSAMALLFALVVAFWVLMERPVLRRELKRLVPERLHEQARMFDLVFTRVMGGYIKATILQCTAIGIACGIGYAIIGVSNLVALAVMTGIFNVIPVIGPWIGGVLVCIMSLDSGIWIALLALAYTIVVQQVIYAFVSPKLMADSVDVHPAIVILAMMIGSAVGATLGGFVGSIVGMLFSIPIAAAAKSIFVYYFEKHTGRRIVSPDGVIFKGAPDAGDAPDPLADAIASRPSSPTGSAFSHLAEHVGHNGDERTSKHDGRLSKK